MRRSLLIAARAATLFVAAGGLALAVWNAEYRAAEPSQTAGPPAPPQRYGIYGPDSKADPHMAREAALAEYRRASDAGVGAVQAEVDASAIQSATDNLMYLPGSKSGFGGLGLRGTGRSPGPAPSLGNLPQKKAP